jgi:hypothetical protein
MTKALQPGCIFERVEKKYLLTDRQYRSLIHKLGPYMHVDEYGLHTICNIYYDTPDSELIRRSIDKPAYKEKLRLRSYGVPKAGDTVFLEIKKKWKKTVYKRRIPLELTQAQAYMKNGAAPDVREEDRQIFNEIAYFKSFYQPVPKLFLAYDRIACVAWDDPELRMTFDAHIRSRTTCLRLDGGDGGVLLLPGDVHLLEIKVLSALPLWLTQILSELEIYPTSFSKYGNIYKEQMKAERNERCLQVS